MLFDGGNSNYHSNENCHKKPVGILRVTDKVLPVSMYSNHILLTLLIELVEVFSVLTSAIISPFISCGSKEARTKSLGIL